MTVRRIIPAIALALLFFTNPVNADPAQDATVFIDEFGHRAIAQLTEPNLSDDELFKRFRALFDEGFDVPAIARSALGRFWPRATDQEKAEYLKVFEEYIVQVYSNKFRQYSGQTFKVTGSRPAERAVVVVSTVDRSDGPTTKINWTIGIVDGKQKIQDIKIEGVSLIISYRDQFASEILQHDGKVSGLIDALREKTAHGDSAGSNG
jgi:phospholipid transport system substrate-binding protein